MKGRDILLRKMKKKAKSFILYGAAAVLIGGLFTAFTIIEKWNILYSIVLGVLGLAGLYLIINGIVILKDPYKDSIFRKNPDLLRMADELYSDIVYQDDFIILSKRLFSPANDPWFLSPLNEVYWVYIQRTFTNGIPTNKELRFVTSTSRFGINISGKKSDDAEKSINILLQACPDLRAGDSPENMAYADAMQREWKINHPDRK